MTLEGAIIFNETDLYTIYTMNSASAGQYCVVLPKNNMGQYNVLVDLHFKSLFDGVNAGSKTKDELVNEIVKEYNNIRTKYNDGILVMPMFDEGNYVNIINTDDKQKMFDEVKKIGAITSELYKKLIDSGIDKQRIDQKIIIVEKDEYDKKFVEWLKGQMPNFVNSVNISELTTVSENTVVADNGNNLFGAPVADATNTVNVVPNDIFGTSNNVAEQQNIQPVVEAPVQQPAVEVPVQQPVENINTVPNVNDGQVVQPAPVVETPVQQPVVDSQQVVAPTPVQSVELEKTVTFSPIGENVATNVSAQQPTPESVQPVADVNNEEVTTEGGVTKKSNGFVNLAILLVVLVGVTLVSIELGKFLYNTYGV